MSDDATQSPLTQATFEALHNGLRAWLHELGRHPPWFPPTDLCLRSLDALVAIGKPYDNLFTTGDTYRTTDATADAVFVQLAKLSIDTLHGGESVSCQPMDPLRVALADAIPPLQQSWLAGRRSLERFYAAWNARRAEDERVREHAAQVLRTNRHPTLRGTVLVKAEDASVEGDWYSGLWAEDQLVVESVRSGYRALRGEHTGEDLAQRLPAARKALEAAYVRDGMADKRHPLRVQSISLCASGVGVLGMPQPHSFRDGKSYEGANLAPRRSDATLWVAANYAPVLFRLWPGRGLTVLNGMSALASVGLLDAAIASLPDEPIDRDYWRCTPGNVRDTLVLLRCMTQTLLDTPSACWDCEPAYVP